jgi:cell division protein FtsX
MKNTIPSLPRVSQDEYDVMTDNEKRQYIIQLQQEDTMKWQKIVAQFQSYMILLSIAVGIFYGVLIVRNEVVEHMESQIQIQSYLDTNINYDTIRVKFSDQELKEVLK